jgi:hypothetical protein
MSVTRGPKFCESTGARTEEQECRQKSFQVQGGPESQKPERNTSGSGTRKSAGVRLQRQERHVNPEVL